MLQSISNISSLTGNTSFLSYKILFYTEIGSILCHFTWQHRYRPATANPYDKYGTNRAMNFPFDHALYSYGSGHSADEKNKQKITESQRKAANERERKRMNSINKGFDSLRRRLPVGSGERKLSKVDTLKHATKYIEQLLELLEEPKKAPHCQSKLVFESNEEKRYRAVFLVSCQKTTDNYGEIFFTPQGLTSCQKEVWHPNK